MQHDLEGLHAVKRRLSDGTVKTYYYTRRGKGGRRIQAEFGTRAFVREFAELRSQEIEIAPQGTVSSLIEDYVASREFDDLKPKTQESYRTSLKKIEKQFGRVPLSVMDMKESRRAIFDWRDSMSDHPRSADMAYAVVKLLLSFGAKWGKLNRNILKGDFKLKPLRSTKDSNRSNIIWSASEIEAFKSIAPPHLTRALVFALNTAQRKKDLLEAKWDQYDGETIMFKQSKTGEFVHLQASAELREMLDALDRTSDFILTNARGDAWGGGFDASWRSVTKKAGITGKTFHDLRGTAVAIAAKAGATVEEIASMTGHSRDHVQTLVERYLPSASVIKKMDALKHNVPSK